jgi:hypothetical protein
MPFYITINYCRPVLKTSIFALQWSTLTLCFSFCRVWLVVSSKAVKKEKNVLQLFLRTLLWLFCDWRQLFSSKFDNLHLFADNGTDECGWIIRKGHLLSDCDLLDQVYIGVIPFYTQ